MLNSKKHSLLICTAMFIFNITIAAMQLGAQVYVHDWKTHGSYIQINQITNDSRNRVWFACDGGAMVFDPADSSFTKFSNINQLSVIGLISCAANAETKEIYFGAKDGTIEIISEDGACTHITDIKAAGFSDPAVTSIAFNGSIAYIAGGFGVASFDIRKKIFIETATKLGSLSPNTGVNSVRIFGSSIYAATKNGLASAELASPLANPASWKNYTYAPGYSSNPTVDVYYFQDSLYILEKYFLLVLRDGAFTVKKTCESYSEFSGFYEYNGSLVFNNQFNYFSATDDKIFGFDWKLINESAVLHLPGRDVLYTEYIENGILIMDGETKTQLSYPSPKWSTFGNVSIDNNNRVWTATGSNFMVLDPQSSTWQHYKLGNGLGGDQRRVIFYPDNRILSTSWGQGMFISEEKDDTLASVQYNEKNSILIGIPSRSDYVVVGEAGLDRNGVLWTVNNNIQTDGYGLVAMDKSGNFYKFEDLESPALKFYYAMAIDQSGTKWMGSIQNGGSMAYYNENYTLNKTTDDYYGVLSTSTLSPNSIVQSIAVDQSGYVWYGAPTGASCLINPQFFRYKQSPIIRKINLMTGQCVNAVMIDATDNKWFATNSGIWVLNPDGSELLLHLTSENSPLISNEVLSITQDKSTGKVFAGTKYGLSEMSTTSITPKSEYDIICSPQPFVPSRDANLIIDGLAESSQVRILTVDGELVRAIETQSRSITWDGRDENGNEAASGVYVIVASSSTTKEKGVGKIALVRK